AAGARRGAGSRSVVGLNEPRMSAGRHAGHEPCGTGERHMDPMTVATSVITILAPYVKDAGEDLLKTVGQVGVEKARTLMGWLKERFAGDPAASKDLSRFETDPKAFEPGLKATIAEKLADPDFAANLE